MFAKFRLLDFENFHENENIAVKKMQEDKKKLETYFQKADIKKYFLSDDEMSAKRIMEGWFNAVDADVFLSHSHMDEPKVASFAYWLEEEYGIKCFIDSFVWGYANKLIEKLDNEFSSPKHLKLDEATNEVSTVFNYNSCLKSSSHVHMMLASALTKMIDKTECFLFLQSSNSASLDFYENMESTKSPWIYHELNTVATIRTHIEDIDLHESFEVAQEHTEIKISYPAQLDDLKTIYMDDLYNLKDNTNHLYGKKLLRTLYSKME